MRFLLVGPEQEENLSLRYLASSLLKAGHDAEIAPFQAPIDQPDVVRQAAGFDVVGLSMVFQARAREFLALARSLKAAGVPRVIAGGHHASFVAEELLRHHPELDLIVLHEGERTVVELADVGFDLSRLEHVPGVVYRDGDTLLRNEPRPMSRDLDALPWPDRRGPVRLMAGVPTSYMLGSRGCLYRCGYCCISTLHREVEGPRLRRREPDAVAHEMADLYHRRGVRQFIFHDDNFLVPRQRENRRRIAAIERGLRDRDVGPIALAVKARPADIQHPVLRQLKDLGLVRLFLGIESGTQSGLDALQRRQELAEANSSLELCRQLGISAQYTLMMFHPWATLDSIRGDLAFFRRHLGHPLNFARTEIYSGTPLLGLMQEAGRARGDYLGHTYRLQDPVADRACTHATRLLRERCWVGGGLMEHVIGADHLAATARRFYGGPDVESAVHAIEGWRDDANRSLVDLLERVIDACVVDGEQGGSVFTEQLQRVRDDELRDRRRLLERGEELRDVLELLCRERVGLRRDGTRDTRSGRSLQLAKHAAAVFLALSGGGLVVNCIGACEYAPEQVPVEPEMSIVSPEDGDEITAGVSFDLVVSLVDDISQFDSIELDLSSSLDGVLPTDDAAYHPPSEQAIIPVTLTTPGEHVLTLIATDGQDLSTVDTVTVQVVTPGDDDSAE